MRNISLRSLWSALTITTLATRTSVSVDGMSTTDAALSDLDASRILWLDFGQANDASDGTVLTEQAGSFNAAVAGDGASRVVGRKDKALNFTGEEYLDLGTSEDLQPEDLSVTFWFKAETEMAGDQVFAWHKNEWGQPGW